jgi:hypothetical protein
VSKSSRSCATCDHTESFHIYFSPNQPRPCGAVRMEYMNPAAPYEHCDCPNFEEVDDDAA